MPSFGFPTRTMSSNRRKFLKAAMAAGAATMAGCLGDDDDDTTTSGGPTPDPDDDETYQTVGPLEWMNWARGDDLAFHLNSTVQGPQIERLGFEIEYQTQAVSTLVDRLVSRDYTMFNSAFLGGVERGDLLFRLSAFYSETAGGGLNYCEYGNETYDELFETFRTIIDPDERAEAAKEVARYNASHQPYIWTSVPAELAATNDDHFTGWKPGPFSWPMMTFDNFSSLEPVGGQDQVIMANTLEPSQVNYMSQTDGLHNKVLNMMYHDHLVYVNAEFEPIPWAAREWDIVDDTTIRFHLREGMTFHDGEPMTAEDIEFTFDYMQEWEVPYLISFYESVDQAVAEDELTVRFDFTEPDGAFIPSGLPQIGILPQHIWDGVVEDEGLEHPREWNDPDAFIGGGPFVLDEVRSGEFIRLATFDDHHSADFDFDSLLWNIYGSTATAVGDLETGNASFMMNLDASNYERLEETDGVTTYGVPGFSADATIVPAGASDIWGDESQTWPWIDPAFHLAVAWATDKEELVNVVRRGLAEPAYSPNPPAHSQGPEDDSLPVTPGGDLDKARQVLADAGYRWDEGRLLMPESRLEEIEQQQLEGAFDHDEYIPASAY